MAAPTPVQSQEWNGRRGAATWRAAWGVGDTDITDSVVSDVSALSPLPGSNAVKLLAADVIVNGNFAVIIEWARVASGTVDTTTLNTRATWVSGDQFDTVWATRPGDITINGVVFTITSVDSATQITLASDPGDQTGVAYQVDEPLERFIGQSDATYQFHRDYTDAPSGGRIPAKTSSTRTGATGDLVLTTSGAANLDELLVRLTFEADR